jgi:hypothetical protein
MDVGRIQPLLVVHKMVNEAFILSQKPPRRHSRPDIRKHYRHSLRACTIMRDEQRA